MAMLSRLAAFLCLTWRVTGFGVPVQVLRPKHLTKDGKKIDNAHGDWSLTMNGKNLLNNVPGPLSIATIVGPYHSGKSYFLNRIMRQFPPKLEDPSNPAGAKAFPVGYSIHPETRGLWLWSDVLQICLDSDSIESNYAWRDARDPNGFAAIDPEFVCDHDQIRTIVFCDTEGLHSPGVDEISDAKMFAIAFLISTELIYNSVKLIDQQQVEYLELLTRRSALFGLRSFATTPQQDSEDNPLLGSLLQPPSLSWTVQDFVQDLEGRTPIQWLSALFLGTPTERFISPSHDASIHPLPLGSMFHTIDAQTFPPPIFSEDVLNGIDGVGLTQQLDKVPDDMLYQPYLDSVSEYSQRLIRRISTHPKTKDRLNGGGFFAGKDVAHLLQFLVEASKVSDNNPQQSDQSDEGIPIINQLFPQVPSVWDQFHKLQTSLVISDLVSDYTNSIQAFQNQASLSLPLQRKLPQAAVHSLYIGPPNLLPQTRSQSFSTRDQQNARKFSLISAHMETTSIASMPLPTDWYPVWSSLAIDRVLSLMKHHIRASGEPISDALQSLFNSKTENDDTRKVIRLMLSKVVRWCRDRSSSGDERSFQVLQELRALPFAHDLFSELRSKHDVFRYQIDEGVHNWCTWTERQISLGIQWMADEFIHDTNVTWSVKDTNQFIKNAPSSYLQFWRTVTNYPGKYMMALSMQGEEGITADPSTHATVEDLMKLRDPVPDPMICSDDFLPPYSLPPTETGGFMFSFTSTKQCQESAVALKKNVDLTAKKLSDLMIHRRGTKLWDFLHSIVSPFVAKWGICLRDGVNLYEWDVFGALNQTARTESFDFLSPPKLTAEFFGGCRDSTGDSPRLLTHFDNIDEVLTTFAERKDHIFVKMLQRESDERYEMDERPKRIYKWLNDTVFVALEETVLSLWETSCMDETDRKVASHSQRLVSRVKSTVVFPAMEEELRHIIAREIATASESLRIELDSCLKLSDPSRSSKISVPKLIEQRIEEKLRNTGEQLEHANLLAIRGLAGEPLRRIFHQLQKEAHTYYFWCNFLPEAYSRAESVIAKASAQNGSLWSPELQRKVARMSVEEMALPIGVEGDNYSHSSHQFLMSMDDGQYKLYDDECSDIVWYDVFQHANCKFKSRDDGSSSLLKGTPYSIIEDNQFAVVGRVIYLVGLVHATYSLLCVDGSCIIRYLFPDNRITRLIGGPSYGQPVRERIESHMSPSRRGLVEERKYSYTHKKDACGSALRLSIFNWPVRQAILCAFGWWYAVYCLSTLIGLMSVVPSGSTDDDDWIKWTVYWSIKFFGYCVDMGFWMVLTLIRRCYSAIYAAMSSYSNNLPVGMFGSAELMLIEKNRRAWYAWPVFTLSFINWGFVVFLIPHFMLDCWSSWKIRLTCKSCPRDTGLPSPQKRFPYMSSPERMSPFNRYAPNKYSDTPSRYDCYPCPHCSKLISPDNPYCDCGDNETWIMPRHSTRDILHGARPRGSVGDYATDMLNECADELMEDLPYRKYKH